MIGNKYCFAFEHSLRGKIKVLVQSVIIMNGKAFMKKSKVW